MRSKRWRRKTNERGEERKEKSRGKSFQRIEKERDKGWMRRKNSLKEKRKFFMSFFPLQTFFTSFSKTHLSLSSSLSLFLLFSSLPLFPSFRSLYLTLVSSYILQGHHIYTSSIFHSWSTFLWKRSDKSLYRGKKRWGSSSWILLPRKKCIFKGKEYRIYTYIHIHIPTYIWGIYIFNVWEVVFPHQN